MPVELNGESTEIEDTDLAQHLLFWLREKQGLTGTKYGCGEGECGACTVLIDDQACLACLVMVGQTSGRRIQTVEGLVDDATGAASMMAIIDSDALQCGFCTPGIVASITASASTSGPQTPSDSARDLAGNLCRCTGYRSIIEASVQVRRPQRPSTATLTETVEAPNFVRPSSLTEVLEVLKSDLTVCLLSGGTDLLVQNHPSELGRILDLTGVQTLGIIAEQDGFVNIGACATYSTIAASPLVLEHCRPLAAAAREIGGTQVQNQATIGGNLANASPAGDTLVCLAVLDAEIELTSAGATRHLRLDDFMIGPGKTQLRPGELISGVRVPVMDEQPDVAFFIKTGARRAQAISIVSVAMLANIESGTLHNVRISFGAVTPAVRRDRSVEAALEGQKVSATNIRRAVNASKASPIDDVRGSADYRKRLMSGLVLRGLGDAGRLPATSSSNKASPNKGDST